VQGIAQKPAEPEEPISSSSGRFELHEKLRGLLSQKYRERKAIEAAFSQPPETPSTYKPGYFRENKKPPGLLRHQNSLSCASGRTARCREKTETAKKIRIKQTRRRTRDLSCDDDKELCPLCAYLDGMVMDPDDPATDIFSPPLFPGCTCRREYILKTEKPGKWPQVSFIFPSKELLGYLQKKF
jgi:hypothetical protein